MDRDYLNLVNNINKNKGSAIVNDQNNQHQQQNSNRRDQMINSNQGDYNNYPSLNASKNNNQFQNYNLNNNNFNNSNNLNETPVHNFDINENVNDGWNNDFEVEVRKNGVKQERTRPFQQQKKRRKTQNNDPNGLNKFLQEDDLNQNQQQMVNENVNMNTNVVTVDMFNKARRNSMLTIAQKIGVNNR